MRLSTPGIQSVPSSGTRAVAAPSALRAPRSSGSKVGGPRQSWSLRAAEGATRATAAPTATRP